MGLPRRVTPIRNCLVRNMTVPGALRRTTWPASWCQAGQAGSAVVPVEAVCARGAVPVATVA